MTATSNEMLEKSAESPHLEHSEMPQLKPHHSAYLLQRHETINLTPLPSANPDDPLNWPEWKKNTQLLMVAFHAMMTTFTAAAIIPAFIPLAEAYKIPAPQASYLTSVQILFLGIFPMVWCPLASRYGRRPILLASTLGSFACNLGGGWCTSYGTQMVTRVLTAICISPALGIGSAVATELFFTQHRAQKLGWWTLMTTLGTPGGPFLMSFVVQHIGYRWIFWILAMINFCQFIAYLILGGETLRKDNILHDISVYKVGSSLKRKTFPARLDFTPLTLFTFLAPLDLMMCSSVIIPACAYAVVFCYANIALIVEMPIIFGIEFGLDTQQIGLQFLALIIGSVIGEQLSGRVSDAVMRRRTSSHMVPSLTRRLWVSYAGFATVIAGLMVWGVRIEEAHGKWNITPLIGAGIAAFGNQIITTTLIAYAIDCYGDRSMDIGVLVNLIRQVWGFIGPAYLPKMFVTLGFSGSAGLMVGVIVVFALLPIALLHYVRR